MNLYEIRDKVAERTLQLVIAENDGMAVRNNLPNFWRFLPQSDVELWKVGKFDEKDGLGDFYTLKEKVDIETAYKFPETKVKNESTTLNEDLKKVHEMQASVNETQEAHKARDTENIETF